MSRQMSEEGALLYNGCSESLVRIELLTLFHRNPGLVCNCAFLAEATGREVEVVRAQAEKLSDLRILEAVEESGEKRYRYLPPWSSSGKEGEGEVEVAD